MVDVLPGIHNSETTSMSGGCHADTATGRILARKLRVTLQMVSVNTESSLYHHFSKFPLTSNSARFGERRTNLV